MALGRTASQILQDMDEEDRQAFSLPSSVPPGAPVEGVPPDAPLDRFYLVLARHVVPSNGVSLTLFAGDRVRVGRHGAAQIDAWVRHHGLRLALEAPSDEAPSSEPPSGGKAEPAGTLVTADLPPAEPGVPPAPALAVPAGLPTTTPDDFDMPTCYADPEDMEPRPDPGPAACLGCFARDRCFNPAASRPKARKRRAQQTGEG